MKPRRSPSPRASLPVLATGEAPGVRGLAAGSAAAAFVPRERDGAAASLSVLGRAAEECTGCRLHENATQVVFGQGPAHARLMLIGEQPGDLEDRAGRPFVGPAGALLNEALEAAAVPREEAYVTNAVKHFSFVQQGKRRLHQKPKASEVKACRAWLAAELERVAPRVLVCLGATAAQSLLGPAFRITKERGRALPTPFGATLVATYHPSALLRAPDEEARRAMWTALVSDLKLAWRLAAQSAAPTLHL